MSYIGWALSPEDRAMLLGEFPPEYPEIIAHHITLRFGVQPDHPLPTATNGVVVGIADDGVGVQALVVEIGGTTDRPKGGTYHITWSIDRKSGAKPVDSNRVIAQGWNKTDRLPIRLIPRMFT